MSRRLLAIGWVLLLTGSVAAPDNGTGRPSISVQTYREAGEDGWFVATLPPPKVSETDVLPVDVTFVVDASGSMRGTRIERAKKAALHLAKTLSTRDRLNVIRFGSTVTAWADAPRPAVEPGLAGLRKFVNDISADGGSALGGAVQRAMAAPAAPDRAQTVVLLTDGGPTVGVTEPSVLFRYARTGATKGIRLHVFGVGGDVDPGFLADLAAAGRGRSEVLTSEKAIETRIGSFFDRAARPVLADVRFAVEGLETYGTDPAIIPDAGKNEPIVVTGRYRGGGEKAVAVTALFRRARVTFSTAANFRKEPGGSPAVKQRVDRSDPGKAWTVPAWLQRDPKFRVRKGAPKSERERLARPKKPDFAVELGLDWLTGKQLASGAFPSDIGGVDGYEVGVTGLVALAFLTNGQTPFEGTRKKTVLNAVKWLLTRQNVEGKFGSPVSAGVEAYGQAIATLAVVEAYGMTGSIFLRQSAQDALDHIAKMQNPYLAWRYGVRPQDNDTSVTTWMLMALRSGRAAGFAVSKDAFDGGKTWYDKVTEPEYGRAGYTSRGSGPARDLDRLTRFPPDKVESLTAMAMFGRVLCGEETSSSEMIEKGTDLCLKALPEWDDSAGTIDMIYWHFGTLALYQVGGRAWKKWDGMYRDAVLPNQRTAGPERGSWDPVGVWGRYGGRVYSTAITVLTLQTWRRYPPLRKR